MDVSQRVQVNEELKNLLFTLINNKNIYFLNHVMNEQNQAFFLEEFRFISERKLIFVFLIQVQLVDSNLFTVMVAKHSLPLVDEPNLEKQFTQMLERHILKSFLVTIINSYTVRDIVCALIVTCKKEYNEIQSE